MRNVLVTGATSPLGRRVAQRIQERPEVERVVGLGSGQHAKRQGGVELVAIRPDHRELVAILRELTIDTVVHCTLAPDRSGASSHSEGGNVIDTMRLATAVGHDDVPVRSWVVASSTEVYPVASSAPLMHREDEAIVADQSSLAATILEAETYARSVAELRPHLCVALLRLQQVVGPELESPMASLLAQPILPTVLGYDPLLQLLHIEDAASAVVFAAELELAGVYNVASEGALRWSAMVKATERRTLPVLGLSPGSLAPVARLLGVPHVPPDLVWLLRYGHAVDIGKLTGAGWKPAYGQRDCLPAGRV
jgi:UDP-glucose 4-epimerase